VVLVERWEEKREGLGIGVWVVCFGDICFILNKNQIIKR
jgi:hypothetical protein